MMLAGIIWEGSTKDGEKVFESHFINIEVMPRKIYLIRWVEILLTNNLGFEELKNI